jgi:hypothetical protein
LSTTVQPASSAGTSFATVTKCGTFHGVIIPATPAGSRRTITGVPNEPVRRSSNGYCPAAFRKPSSAISVAPTWPTCENQSGAPISALISSASSSCRARYAAANRRTAAIRSAGAVCGHGPSSNAVRAAATARSTSSSVASGALPTGSAVCGDTTRIRRSLAGATHRPPM